MRPGRSGEADGEAVCEHDDPEEVDAETEPKTERDKAKDDDGKLETRHDVVPPRGLQNARDDGRDAETGAVIA